MSEPAQPAVIFALPEWLPHLGGLATFYAQLAQCRSQQGKPTTILTTQKQATDPNWPHVTVVSLEKQKNDDFVKYCQWLPEGWEVAALSLATGAAMRDYLLENASAQDVVFAAEFLGYASILCDPALPPLVVTAHGSMGQIAARSQGGMTSPDAALVRQLESDALLRAEVTTAYSPMNAQEWTAILDRNIPCVDPPFFMYPKVDTTPASTPLTGVVLGRLQDWKGAQTLADALARLDSNAPIRIDWYGSDTTTAPGGTSMAAWLEKTYPQVWGKTFHWNGPVPRETALRHQAEANLALVPSRWDTLNFTVLEAVNAGTPVIVSTGAGASYLIEDGVTGHTFPVGDDAALANLLQQLIAQPESLPILAENAHRTLGDRLAPQACVARYDALAQDAQRIRQSKQRDLVNNSAGATLLPLLDAIMQPNRLPQRSSRELLNALTQKLGKRLVFDR